MKRPPEVPKDFPVQPPSACTCRTAGCLGPSGGARHRIPGVVSGRDGRYVVVQSSEGIAHFLLPGYQIEHADAVPGVRGMLEYRSDGRSGLHYFVREAS